MSKPKLCIKLQVNLSFKFSNKKYISQSVFQTLLNLYNGLFYKNNSQLLAINYFGKTTLQNMLDTNLYMVF